MDKKDEYIEELEKFIFDICDEIEDFHDMADVCLASGPRIDEMLDTMRKVKIKYLKKHGG